MKIKTILPKQGYERYSVNRGNKYTSNCQHKPPYLTGPHLMIVILVVTLILLVCLLSITAVVVHQEMNNIYYNRLKSFTVPCEDLSLSPYEDSETFDTKESGLKTSVDNNWRYMCNSENLTKTVEMVVERQKRLRLAKGLFGPQYYSCGNESLAPKSGHQTVAFTKIAILHNSSDDVKLNWNKDPTSSYIGPTVRYDDGEITIPEGRTYFIYASVQFNLSQGHQDDTKHPNIPFQVSIRLCKMAFDYERTLLGSTKLFYTNSNNTVSSLVIQSPLPFSRGDKVYVRVSGAKRLVLDSVGNTFGLVPL